MKELKRKRYEELIEPMEAELVAMARWVAATGQRLLILFEGRDTGGKGGAIGAIANVLNPRQCRIVALSKPTEAEAGQWYFQRYVAQLPTAGEMACLRIFSGVLAATSSISMPPSVDAMTVTLPVARSRVRPR